MFKSKDKEVALLLPNTNPILSAISNGLLGALAQTRIPLDVVQLNAEENYEAFNLQLDEFFHKFDPDLIYSIGDRCTEAIKRKTEEKKRPIPIVFGALHKPKKTELTGNNVYSENHLTGITTGNAHKFNDDFTTLIRQHIFPNFQNILMLIDDTVFESSQRSKEVGVLLTKKGANVRSVSINDTSRILEVVKPHLSWTSIIVVPRQTQLMVRVKEFAVIAYELKIPLITANTESVEIGIPLGYGMDGKLTGQQIAHHSLPILENRIHPNKIKIEQLKMDCKLYVNKEITNYLNLNTTQIEKSGDIVICR